MDDCFRGQSSEGSLKKKEIDGHGADRANLLFDVIEFPTMLRPTDGERTGQSGGTYKHVEKCFRFDAKVTEKEDS